MSRKELMTISAVNPEFYKARFQNFLVSHLLKPGRDQFMNDEQNSKSEDFLYDLAYQIRAGELVK